MTEQEMRDTDVPRLETLDELTAYIEGLVKQEHDYGTCVYAMSMAATAAFNYVASELGVTGFQASCADMDILRRTRHLKGGFRIINYENLLYPQYWDDEHFPSADKLANENREWLAKEAKKLLAENEGSQFVHGNVWNHWRRLALLGDDAKVDV